MENYELITENGQLKNAAILLFGKRPRKFFTGIEFKIGRFGKSISDLIFEDIIEGNILQMADRVMEVLKSKYLTSPIHYEGMRRIEPLELPEDGLREIIYNSICHKLYGGAPIQMRVYNDSVNIWNDGELPMGYTVDTLLGEHGSKPRNHHIAEVFHAAGFIEAWGRGYEKIEESFADAGLPMPVIEASQGGVWVRIQRRDPFTNVGINAGINAGINVGIKLTKRQDVMLDLLRHDAKIPAEEMSVKMSVNKRTIERNLAALQKNKIIFREGSRKFGHWVVVKSE